MSSFWFNFSLFVTLLVIIKIYLGFGLYQATRSIRWAIIYEMASLVSLGVGLPTVFSGVSDWMMGMTWWQNMIIGLMVTFICCEVILLFFFVVDDVLRIFSFVKQKILPTSSSTTVTVSSLKRRRLLKTIGLGITSIPFFSFLHP